MRIYITTSDKYKHVLPTFFASYKKYWDMPATLVGYMAPDALPDGIDFISMGEDRGPKYWSTDLRKFFEDKDEWFVWIMEDTFIKAHIDMEAFNFCVGLCYDGIGRVDLTKDIQKREHTVNNEVVWAHPNSRYRLSTQPSIWSKSYLLNYLHDGMDPWTFETQDPMNDGWQVVGALNYPILHNEGVRRHNIFSFNMDGITDPEILSLCSNYI